MQLFGVTDCQTGRGRRVCWKEAMSSARLRESWNPIVARTKDIRAFGVAKPVAIIPNGIDLPEQQGKRVGMIAADRIILSLGRIHPKKGLDLVRAWAKEGRLSRVAVEDRGAIRDWTRRRVAGFGRQA
jgi:glycosyltransferase involved in cell wall biosynthesis